MIIGLMGKAGSGKDEFAKVAAEKFGVIRVAFGDTVKEEVGAFLDKHEVCWEHRHLWGSQSDKEATLRVRHSEVKPRSLMSRFLTKFGDYNNGWHYFTSRSLLQWHGTEYRRAQDQDYWVKRAAEKMKDTSNWYCLTDCRFPNEVGMLHALGGKLIKIVRDNAPAISNMDHASETTLECLNLHDHVLYNNGSLEEFHTNVIDLLELIDGR